MKQAYYPAVQRESYMEGRTLRLLNLTYLKRRVAVWE
jgi:hypothetical protein